MSVVARNFAKAFSLNKTQLIALEQHLNESLHRFYRNNPEYLHDRDFNINEALRLPDLSQLGYELSDPANIVDTNHMSKKPLLEVSDSEQNFSLT